MNEEIEIKKASILRRIIAFYLDMFIITFVLTVGFFLFLGSDINTVDFEKWVLAFNIYMVLGISAVLLKDCFNGASPGRYVLNIAVRDANNYQLVPKKRKLILRNVIMLIWPVEFLFLLINSDRKRIGDRIAHTQVIKSTQKRSSIKRIVFLLGILVLIILITILSILHLLRNSEAYKVSTEFIFNKKTEPELGN